MALVAFGFTGYVTLADNGANETTKTYTLQATDAASALTSISAIVAALIAVTNAVVIAYGVTHRFVNDAVAFPASGVEIQNLALVNCAIKDEPTKNATFTIPAPKASLFVGVVGEPANSVDITDTALVTYSDLFKLSGSAYISDGETIDYMKQGRRIHRKSRRG